MYALCGSGPCESLHVYTVSGPCESLHVCTVYLALARAYMYALCVSGPCESLHVCTVCIWRLRELTCMHCVYLALARAYMYALCVSGAVNTQRFVWTFFMRYNIYMFIHSFILCWLVLPRDSVTIDVASCESWEVGPTVHKTAHHGVAPVWRVRVAVDRIFAVFWS